ncbi:ABC-F family ATP-binding cassette domain-containing protein [Dehalobacterium formicoaceticum]|uniref:ABC-F family ATP-binding cassette domain-containing protein n=1 Tax=Dehalobacterium formicoaceticum TaxID=51515 RepID=A0ABT1Y0E6_9FIRM|nr:ABC-F family ATP-binding cassette domain-containing protein [Dehalobacterium formicoaceticum]MCR6544338.1 ABC-F family ATP-binding cassette domain-containing protein [Dehalobacterium formicoaceticum]
MIILQVKNLSKSYGIHEIFSGLSFALHEGERVGLIGSNGTGKSTLFKCLTGEESPDGGSIMINERTTIGFLAQQNDWNEHISLFDEMLQGFEDTIEDRKTLREMEKRMASIREDDLPDLMHQYAQVTERYERAGGYALEATVRKVIKGLGFTDEDLSQTVSTMSGGQKTRAALAKALLQQPDILFLDEPTNHLDINGIEWLEDFLVTYPKTVFLVSHDRYFLDKTVNRIMELERGKITSYQENYQGYLRRKGEFEESYQRAYLKQQQVIAQTESFIRRYKAGVKSKQARGRETILKRMERMEKLTEQKIIQPRLLAPVPESGSQVLQLETLAHGFKGQPLFQDLNGTIHNGEKVALVGNNGTGKSTILKIIMGEIMPNQGSVKFGSRVVPGYYAQEQETLDWNQTILQEIMNTINKGQEEARSLLASFLFRGDDVEKKIESLSGGEKARIALLKLLLKGANLLVLDEPTNHLDIASKQVVEDFLDDYPGTIILVSHDRYFLDKVVDRIWELEDGQIHDYPGNYTYYRYKKKENAAAENKPAPNTPKGDHLEARILAKEQSKNLKQLTRRLEILEDELAKMEQEKEEVAGMMSNPEIFGDGEGTEIKSLVARYQGLEENISRSYQEWEELMAEQEELEMIMAEQN